MSYKNQGDPVNITFSSADVTTLTPIVLTDANGNAVTLAAWQGLLLDAVSAFTALTGTNRVELIHDADAGGDVDSNEIIASFGVGNGGIGFPGDGYACKTGLTPKLKATAAGQVIVTGTARIVNRTGEGARPSWREAEVGR